MKQYMLDTDTCSYILRERPTSVLERFEQLSTECVCISMITYAELLYGVRRSSSSKVNKPIVDDFVRRLRIMRWDENAAEHYSDIRVSLEQAGTPIGALDTMISAHARSLSATVVTNNSKHFGRVKNLEIENWVST